MSTYTCRRLSRNVIYLLVVLLALPPGWMSSAMAASRTATFTHDTDMETFRNPSFSSGGTNRFLYTHNPKALVAGGGDNFANPSARGVRGGAEPATLWLPNDGRLQWSAIDMVLPGVGSSLSFQRIYRGTVSAYDGPLGNRWDFNWNVRLYEDGNNDITAYEMGRFDVYDEVSGNYTEPAYRYDTMAKSGGEVTRTDKWGSEEIFEADDPSGWYRIKSIEDLNSNTITFAYDSAGNNSNLTKVTDTLGQDATLSYDTSDRLTKIADHASREWIYGYDASANLTSVRTPTVDETGTDHDFTSGKTTTYEYDTSDRLTELFRPEDGATGTYRWYYDSAGAITSVRSNGNAQSISYDDDNNRMTVTRREGERLEYRYDNSNRITERYVHYSGGSWQTDFAYDAQSEVTDVTFPNGNIVSYTYSADGDVTQVALSRTSSDTSPIEWDYTYTTNSRLSTLTDPNGKLWDYDYDANENLITKTWPSVTLPSGIATTDKNGNAVNDGTILQSWTVNSSGQVTEATDSYRAKTKYEYSTVNSNSAYLTKVTRDSAVGGLALATTYAYDGVGNVTSVTDPNGNVTTSTVNDLNQTILAIEPGSVTRETYYDKNDRVTKVELSNDTDVGNGLFVVDQAYDQIDNLTRVIEDETDTARLTTAYAFDKNDRLTKTTSPDGDEVVYDYDERDLRLTVTREAPSGTDAITIYKYDNNGNRTTSKDPLGNETISAYDGLDRVTKVTQAEGNYRELVYDDAGNVVTSTSKNSTNTMLARTVTAYDEANRAYKTEKLAKKADLSTSLGDGLQTKTIWRDERGSVLEYQDDVCGCNLYEYVYDSVGRRVTTKDPMGATDATRNLVLTEYDKNGNVTKTTREDRTQDSGIEASKDIVDERVYDARNRSITRRERTGPSTTLDTVYHYGLRDQVTKTVDDEGNEIRLEYNEQLWKTKETLENGAADVVTEYTYDDDGNLVTYKAKNATTGDQSTIYTYDDLDRLVTTEWPDTGKLIQTYDAASNRISTTDPNTTVVVCAYDDNNRLTNKTMTLASGVLGNDDIDYGYDGLNRVTSIDAAEGVSFASVVERTYNTLGHIETEKQVIDGYASGAGRTITYDWDVSGQKTGMTLPVSGDVVTYTRDALDRADKISLETTEVVDYAFNGKRVIEKAMPGSSGEYTYDTYGRLTEIHHKDTSSSNTLAKFVYGYDDAHQIISQDKHFYDDVENTRMTGRTIDLGDQYGYDGAKRLVTVLRGVATADIDTALATNVTNGDYNDLADYTYDPTGNRTTLDVTPQGGSADTTAYAHNKVNEMTTEDGTTQVYDANGNSSGPSGSEDYSYDFQNNLAEYDPSGDTGWEWHFDGLGRRIQRDNYETGRGQRFYYDGIHVVEQVLWANSTETHTKQFVYEESIDELLSYVNLGPNPDVEYYAHGDRLGSVVLLVEDDGDIAESYRYQEFGVTDIIDSSFLVKTTQPHLSSVGNPYRYTGRRQDRQMGAAADDDWYYNRAREMRARVGRFQQMDPAGYVDGASGYVYVANGPVMNTDPTGRMIGTGPSLGCGPNCGTTGASPSAGRVIPPTPPSGTIPSDCGPIPPLSLVFNFHWSCNGPSGVPACTCNFNLPPNPTPDMFVDVGPAPTWTAAGCSFELKSSIHVPAHVCVGLTAPHLGCKVIEGVFWTLSYTCTGTFNCGGLEYPSSPKKGTFILDTCVANSGLILQVPFLP